VKDHKREINAPCDEKYRSVLSGHYIRHPRAFPQERSLLCPVCSMKQGENAVPTPCWKEKIHAACLPCHPSIAQYNWQIMYRATARPTATKTNGEKSTQSEKKSETL
jgi:hypothetical protein